MKNALLLFATVAALVWANTPLAPWHDVLLGGRVEQVINDGLMALFFLQVGLEMKRELVHGELNSFPKATLPAVAAVGGMLFPAGIYLLLNHHRASASGFGVPMATDIAFSLAVLTALGARVPRALVVFLTALAVFDDLGGILVIALFYGEGFHWPGLLALLLCCGALVVLNRRGIYSRALFLGLGGALWLSLHFAGVHPTLSGVVLGLFVPTSKVETLEHPLAPWVGWVVLPLFALANSAIPLAGFTAALGSAVTLGIGLGLVLGKPLGISLTTWVVTRLRLAPLPAGTGGRAILGVGLVAGIGFTVALFVANLAFADAALVREAKLGILAGSVVSAALGALVLRTLPKAA